MSKFSAVSNLPYRALAFVRRRLRTRSARHSSIRVLNRPCEITDRRWHAFSRREIFSDEVYRFVASRPKPHIIDCGANVGMSVIYFKNLYPDSTVLAFEPDPTQFQILQRNVATYGLSGVTMHRKAVWNASTALSFQPSGGIGGRVVDEGAVRNAITVEAVRLRDFLTTHVDLLKMDIEGAEYAVLEDCQDKLYLVENIFVEFHERVREEQRLHDMLSILKRAGFRYHIKEAYPIDHPFIRDEYRTHSRYDLQLNVYGFRVH